jgi:hypothetical protein
LPDGSVLGTTAKRHLLKEREPSEFGRRCTRAVDSTRALILWQTAARVAWTPALSPPDVSIGGVAGS